jgi:hypothetical protein
MNKHQIKTERTTKLSNLIKTSNDSLNNNNNTIKKIKLEPNETTTTNVIKASSPINTITSPNPSTVVTGIVDTYFAAKMADRVSCDICHKVNLNLINYIIIFSFFFFYSSRYVINIFLKLINLKFMVLILIQ